MRFDLKNTPANRAYDVFRSLFASTEELDFWLLQHKEDISTDCIYHDGTDAFPKQYVDRIQTEDPKTGQITVFGGMPSTVTVWGIGTKQERAVLTWQSPASGSSNAPTQLQEPQEHLYERTPEEYRLWAKANGIRSRMPILKK